SLYNAQSFVFFYSYRAPRHLPSFPTRRSSDLLGPFMVWRPPEPLAEGEHSIEVRVPRPVFGDSVHRWEFTVDGTPPALEVPTATDPVGIDEPAEVSGTVEEGAELTADGDPVEVDDEGRFTLSFDRPPAGPITL